MIQRCESPNCRDFRWYGARGISVHPNWRHDFSAFREWALAHGYADHLTIDRIDNDGHYEPGNCQWISRKENASRAARHRRGAA